MVMMKFSDEHKYDDLGLLEKALVRHSHPVSFIAHLVGLMWGGYFLWMHQMFFAIGCFVVIIGVGEFMGWTDKDFLAQARMKLNGFQRALVFHADTRNVILHAIGLYFYLSGTFHNSVPRLLLAVSFVLLGHIFPWMSRRRLEGQHARAIED